VVLSGTSLMVTLQAAIGAMRRIYHGPMECRVAWRLGVWIVGIGLAACSFASSQEASAMTSIGTTTMTLHSSAFPDGGTIPAKHTCDGDDVSPQLVWDQVPEGTQSFALLVTDPGAHDFVHWILTDIPGDVRELPERRGDAIGVPGPTSFGPVGWRGPCPPSGTHRYVFTLYALPEPLGLGGEAGAEALQNAARMNALGTVQLTGTYAR
jgi:Raf kinase inhibitor-like YbhB/YbcL family protein